MGTGLRISSFSIGPRERWVPSVSGSRIVQERVIEPRALSTLAGAGVAARRETADLSSYQFGRNHVTEDLGEHSLRLRLRPAPQHPRCPSRQAPSVGRISSPHDRGVAHRCCSGKSPENGSYVSAQVRFLPTSTFAFRLPATPTVLGLVRIPDLAVLLSTVHPPLVDGGTKRGLRASLRACGTPSGSCVE